MNEIFRYIENSSNIQKTIRGAIEPRLYDDFKSEVYLVLLELKDDKLITAYNEGWIDFLVFRIVTNTKGSNSRFHKEFRKFGLRQAIVTEIDNDCLQYLQSTSDIKYIKEKEEILIQMQLILTNLSYLDKLLFMKYYFDGIDMKTMSKELGYNYTTVRKSVKRTFDYLKNKLNEYDNYNFDDFTLDFED